MSSAPLPTVFATVLISRFIAFVDAKLPFQILDIVEASSTKAIVFDFFLTVIIDTSYWSRATAAAQTSLFAIVKRMVRHNYQQDLYSIRGICDFQLGNRSSTNSEHVQ